MKLDYKKIYPHIAAVLIFLLLSLIFLSPVFEGLVLKQEDIGRHKGVAKEIYDHRKEYDEEPLWTNSMFGGMPATQVSVVHDSNLMMYVDKVMTLWLPHPVSYMFLYFLGFYILCICLSIRPWLSIVGALMFGLSSFFFISIAAGHNSKLMAMAYMPMIIGAFIYAIRNKAITGSILFAFFLALELRSNHVQITYYAFMIIFAIGIYELIRYYKDKKLLSFFKRAGLLLTAGVLAIACNSGNLFMTYDYLPDSQRGQSELTIENPTQNNKKKTDGLDIDYMTQWSYGLGESFNLIVPNIKGGGSGPYILEKDIMEDDSTSLELKQFLSKDHKWSNSNNDKISYIDKYWGDQPFTSGPVYIGASIFFLFLLGLVFLEDKIKWALLIVSIIALMLSWGHNLMGFTEFFVDFFPGYSKFRSVTMILVIIELIVPMIAIMWLFQFISKDDDKLKLNQSTKLFGNNFTRFNLLYVLSGLFMFFLLLMVIAPDIFLNFISSKENLFFKDLLLKDPTLTNIKSELIEYRRSVVAVDAVRSLILVAIVFLFIFFYLRKKVNQYVLITIICLVSIFDLWNVSKRFLHNNEYTAREQQMMQSNGLKHWEDKELKLFPNQAQAADLAILEEEKKNDPDLKSKVENHNKEIYKEFEGNKHIKRIVDAEAFSVLNFNSNYRVLELGNPLNTARTSYFHKSIGGYSAVKVKRVQEVIDFYFGKELYNFQLGFSEFANSIQSVNPESVFNPFNRNLLSLNIFNMLNTRYFIFSLDGEDIINTVNYSIGQNPGIIKNPYALGNAWAIKDILWVKSADEEIKLLGDPAFNPANSVIIDDRYKDIIGNVIPNGMAEITMINYKANHITYEYDSKDNDFVVFSEIFYDKGWKAYIDGKEVPHLRVNYILRGLKVPPGNHKIEFKFDLPIYHTASLISLASSSILILLFGLILFMKFRGKNFPEI